LLLKLKKVLLEKFSLVLLDLRLKLGLLLVSFQLLLDLLDVGGSELRQQRTKLDSRLCKSPMCHCRINTL